MNKNKEFIASKGVFANFIEKSKENKWLKSFDPEYSVEKLTYFDTHDLGLYHKKVTVAHGKNSVEGSFLSFSEEDCLTIYRLRGSSGKDEMSYSNIFHLAAMNIYDVTKELHPIFQSFTQKTAVDLFMNSDGQEHSIVRVMLNEASDISLLQQNGQTSIETITLETMIGSDLYQDIVENELKKVIADQLGVEAFETSIAEVGFDFHQKFTPQAKDNLGNYITCDID